MTNDDLTIEDVRKMAADIGMTRLNDGELQELLRATVTARARRDALRTGELALTDEPAHVFSLAEGDRR
jgi:hypothetical protein